MNNRTLEKRTGRNWETIETLKNNDTAIFKSLSNELINKYVYKSNWVRRVDIDIYHSGTQNKIIVTFDNGYRHIYEIDK